MNETRPLRILPGPPGDSREPLIYLAALLVAVLVGAAAVFAATRLMAPAPATAAVTVASPPQVITVTGSAPVPALFTGGQTKSGYQTMEFTLEGSSTSSTAAALSSLERNLTAIRQTVAGVNGTVTSESISLLPASSLKAGPGGGPASGSAAPYVATADVQTQLPAGADLTSVTLAALKSGATGFNLYTSQPSASARAKAVSTAFASAQGEAQALAKGMGVHLTRLQKAVVDPQTNVGAPQGFVQVSLTYAYDK